MRKWRQNWPHFIEEVIFRKSKSYLALLQFLTETIWDTFSKVYQLLDVAVTTPRVCQMRAYFFTRSRIKTFLRTPWLMIGSMHLQHYQFIREWYAMSSRFNELVTIQKSSCWISLQDPSQMMNKLSSTNNINNNIFMFQMEHID